MFTVCPKCALTLIVTAADLRAGQGYVRCGRCSNVFNALVSLTDDRAEQMHTPVSDSTRDKAREESAEQPIEQPTGHAAVEPPQTSSQELPHEMPAAAERDEVSDRALEFNAASTNVSEVFVEPEHGVAQAIGTGTFKMLVLRNKDLAQTLGLDDEEEPVEALEASGTHEEISDALRNEVSAAAESNASTLEWLQGRSAEPTVPARTRRLWSAAAAVLVLALAAQIVNHYRDNLATVPSLAPALNGIYDALGVDLHPNWDLSAYDVRQLGAAADGANAGALRLRASIANRASQAQPLPLLRVTMQDRFGNPIAARDVAPALYAGAPGNRLLGVGERVDAQIVFHDPGRNAVGFELDACLPMAGARIVCALGQKPR